MKKKILFLGIALGVGFLLSANLNLIEASFVGNITPPDIFQKYQTTINGVVTPGDEAAGLMILLNNVLRLVIVLAGLFAFINILFAGYGFLGASGDPKKMEAAWSKIWQSMLGLLVILGSFVLAGIFGWLLFGDARAILSPKLYGPGI